MFIGLLITLREPISSLMDRLLVQPVFSKISSSLATDLGVIFSLTLIVLSIWDNRDHKWITKCTGILLILFITFRFGGYWTYTSLYLFDNNQILYIDLIALACFILLGRHAYLLYKSKSKEEFRSINSGFIEDNAVEKTEDDSYERSQVAEHVAKQIISTENKKAFAIGITGPYGSGKTSFINLICQSFKKEKSNALIIHFNPWDANSSADIQKLFFDELSITLAKEDSALSSSMYSYYRRLTGKNTFAGSVINNLRDFSLVISPDLDDERAKINEMMNKLSRKVIIVIDDLDRLHKEEVMEVLRLIRNTANFGNIIYIVAYDKEYVEQSIKKLNERAYANYLDKIFQIEIPLPKSENFLIADALLKSLGDVIKPKELDYIKKNFIPLHFESEFEESIATIFRSQRDIIRFTNSFKLNYSMISEEVDFVQLFYIQILKFRFPLVFETLYDRRKEVLITSDNNLLYRKSYSLRKSSENSKDDYLILDILKSALNDQDKILVKYILNHLFKLVLTLDHRDKMKTITNPDFFDLFFTIRISSTGLSEEGFRKHMLGDIKSIEAYINNQIKEERHIPLIRRILKMEVEHFTSKDHYETILYAFMKLIIPAYIEKEGLKQFLFDRFIFVHFNEWNTITNKYYNGDIKAFNIHLSKLLSFHKESYLFIGELAQRIRVRYGDKGQFPENVLFKVQLECLIEGLDKNPTVITPEVVWMFWGIREFNRDVKHGNERMDIDEQSWKIHHEAVEILHARIHHRDLKNLLQSLISKHMYSEDQYGLANKLINDVFGNIYNLKEIVEKNNKTDEKIKMEFLDFLGKYSDAKDYVEYNFNYLEGN